jgi:hypothetical protein
MAISSCADISPAMRRMETATFTNSTRNPNNNTRLFTCESKLLNIGLSPQFTAENY